MSGHFLLPAQQVVLVEKGSYPSSIDHAARFALMGRSAQAAPAATQPWWIFQQKPSAVPQENFDTQRRHDGLHAYRVGYQTVGQPWATWPPSIASRASQFASEPFEGGRRHDALHVYRVGYQTVGQSWLLWPTAAKQPGNTEPSAGIVDHAARFAFMGRAAPAAPTSVQPWWIWNQAARAADVPDEPPRRVADNLHLFRQPPASGPQPSQPWWMWRLTARIETPEQQVRPQLHDLTPYRRAPQAVTAQPWWLLRWAPPRFAPDEYDQRAKRFELPRNPGATQPLVDYADTEDTLTVSIDNQLLAADDIDDLFSVDLTDRLLDVPTDDAPWPIDPNETLH